MHTRAAQCPVPMHHAEFASYGGWNQGIDLDSSKRSRLLFKSLSSFGSIKKWREIRNCFFARFDRVLLVGPPAVVLPLLAEPTQVCPARGVQ
jgi:hypothetical protein